MRYLMSDTSVSTLAVLSMGMAVVVLALLRTYHTSRPLSELYLTVNVFVAPSDGAVSELVISRRRMVKWPTHPGRKVVRQHTEFIHLGDARTLHVPDQ